MSILLGIPNWNTLDYLIPLLESFNKFVPKSLNAEIAIWDNGSEAHEKEHLNKLLNSNQIQHYFSSPTNQYMVEPWNWMLRFFDIKPEMTHCMICNSDIRFTINSFSIFDKFKELNQYGLICPEILPKGYETIPDDSYLATRLCSEEIDDKALNGPCMIITRNCYKKVGLFDERLTLSFNDMDYHQRVLKAGLKACVYKGSYIWHKGGVCTSRIDVGVPRINNPFYDIFQEKHG